MIEFVRVDDRLIHGQVVLGWGHALRPDRVVLADDDVSANEWERNLYTQAWPDVRISILSLEAAAEQLKSDVFGKEKILLVVQNPKSVLKLMDLGVPMTVVNVGGLHFREGREKLVEGVYADFEERSVLRELVKRGVRLDAREVPSSREVYLNSILA